MLAGRTVTLLVVMSLLILMTLLIVILGASASAPIVADKDTHVPTARRLSGKGAFLHRQMLKNTSVTCNDGTTAGFYIRTNAASKRWLVFLEGGWHCFSSLSCHQRWSRARSLMTSAHWPQIRNSK